MSHNRRSFVESAVAGAAAMAVLPGKLFAGIPADLNRASPASAEWDLKWVDKVNGKHRAVFDNTEPESGYGVWRASLWVRQYMDVMKVAPADMSPVLVLRHNAIALAMQQSFWDKYGIGAKKNVTHPLTGEMTPKNPALLDEKDGIPSPFNMAGLQKQLDRGVTVLACNLAFQDCVDLIKGTDKVAEAEARKRALSMLVSGVILQPSGVFAVIRAQEAGAAYIKAS